MSNDVNDILKGLQEKGQLKGLEVRGKTTSFFINGQQMVVSVGVDASSSIKNSVRDYARHQGHDRFEFITLTLRQAGLVSVSNKHLTIFKIHNHEFKLTRDPSGVYISKTNYPHEPFVAEGRMDPLFWLEHYTNSIMFRQLLQLFDESISLSIQTELPRYNKIAKSEMGFRIHADIDDLERPLSFLRRDGYIDSQQYRTARNQIQSDPESVRGFIMKFYYTEEDDDGQISWIRYRPEVTVGQTIYFFSPDEEPTVIGKAVVASIDKYQDVGLDSYTDILRFKTEIEMDIGLGSKMHNVIVNSVNTMAYGYTWGLQQDVDHLWFPTAANVDIMTEPIELE